jgi:hypothetical protein
MKKNFIVYASMLIAFTFLIFSCNPVEPQEKKVEEVKEEIKEEVKDNKADLKAEAEAEMKEIEAELAQLLAPKTRDGKAASVKFNFDKDCDERCLGIGNQMGSITQGGDTYNKYLDCVQNCLAQKQKELAEKEAAAEKEKLEKEKEMLLEWAKQQFMACIASKTTEEEKKSCREDYMTEKEIYYNHGK